MTIFIAIFAIFFLLDWKEFHPMSVTAMVTWSGSFRSPIDVLFIAGFRT